MCLDEWFNTFATFVFDWTASLFESIISLPTSSLLLTCTIAVITFVFVRHQMIQTMSKTKSNNYSNNSNSKANPQNKYALGADPTDTRAIDYQEQSWREAEMELSPRYYQGKQASRLMTSLFDDATTMLESMERGKRINANGNCMGKINATKKEVTWFSYETVSERITKFGNGLYHLLGEDSLFGRKEFQAVGIYSVNRYEYIIAEYGCYLHSFVTVPIYDTLGPNACSFITNQVELQCIVCDKLERVQVILSQANVLKSIRYLVVFEDIPQSYKAKAQSHNINVFTIEEIEILGSCHAVQSHKPKPNDLAIVCYTSGTTDIPKGVMLTHGNVVACVSAVMYQMGEHTIRGDDIHMSYLPLAHMFERCCENAVFMVGGAVVFFSGDVKMLSNDMKIAMPTLLPAVPRLLTRIYCKIQDSVKSNVIKSLLLNTAYHFKQKKFEKSGIVRKDTFWDRVVFRKIRETLGGRVRLIISGSAPLNPNVLEFLRCALGCVLFEGYGQTECVAPCTCTFAGDIKTGHVGPPIAAAKLKLADVPEMGYKASEGKGEILVKGPIVFQGYYKDPERTSKAIDKDGWLHTGDIGLFNENGTVKIIDRKKNIFKLSQGEYISPEKIESIYSQCTMVAQIFVYGESLKSTLVAIVVPDQAVLESWCNNNNIRGEFKQLCLEKDVKKVILKELHQLGQRDGLKSFEQVKDVHIHDELFSIDNGLLTPTLKSKREEISKQFQKQIQRLYSHLE